MEVERHKNLHTIIMLKELIRKWWGAELCFADQSGAVDWTEGQRRCGDSIGLLHERFKTSKKLRRAQAVDCHPGFTIVGAPLYLRGDYQGFFFVHLPQMSAPEIERLTDVLELAVSEIASDEDDSTHRARRAGRPPPELVRPYRFEHIVGNGERMRELFGLLEKVCNSESTVLISGESGTGKELVARAICYNGPRRDKPFVVQNCSAFNDNLLEAALFGHTRGSFTGALRDQKGLFETADGGTFFLDEVGDMSPALQVKLLRVLQEGTFLPLGATQTKEVDVRLIAATHKDLAQMVKDGTFREDLFYRINVIPIQVPSLRERPEDIPVLVEHFLRKHRREGQRSRSLSREASQILTTYSWPGNVRELENEIERLLALGPELDVIPAELISPRILESVPEGAKHVARESHSGKLNEMVESLEREVIRAGLERTGNNKSRLARDLGISRSNLILKISRYGLEPPGEEQDDGTATA
ncbi:MAG TPA: sigma-54 dependent transcriptional regulator [Myxococcaceae bacterium]|nr:sigma-54 dependent transcriptional regulator [Myxococcaceae bacterium]